MTGEGELVTLDDFNSIPSATPGERRVTLDDFNSVPSRDVAADRPEPLENADLALARVVCVADVEAERVRWLWPGWVPRGKLAVLDGDPGLGKSTALLDLAARVSTGSPLPDGSPLEAAESVLILSAEDGVADTIRPRLEAAGADLGRVYVLDAVRDGEGERPPELPADLPLIERIATERKVALIIVDPLLAFLAGNVDSHRDQDVRRALHALAMVAERTGAAIVVVRHLNKTSGPKALYRGGGSIGIIGAARSGLLVAEDPQDADRRVLASIKANLAKRPDALAFRLVPDPLREVARISWEGVVDIDADVLLGPQLDSKRTAQDEAEDFLRAKLPMGTTRPARDVQDEAANEGIKERTLERAKTALRIESEREGGLGSAGRWLWRLPTDGDLSESASGPGVLSGNGLNKPNPATDRASDEPKTANMQLGGLRVPLPGDEGFRAFLNAVYAAGHITARERHERRLLHNLIVRAGTV